MKFLSFLCTKWMENCEAMTSLPHSFAYSYRLVNKCFLKICETSKFHNLLIFQLIFIRFSLLCLKNFTLSSEIELNLLWSSSLNKCVDLKEILQSFIHHTMFLYHQEVHINGYLFKSYWHMAYRRMIYASPFFFCKYLISILYFFL